MPPNCPNRSTGPRIEHRKRESISALAQVTWLLLFMHSGCTALFGTSVVVLYSQSTIVIAADSKITSPDKGHLPHVCKIQVVGNYVYSYAGFNMYTPTDFYPGRSLYAAAMQADSVSEAADIATSYIGNELKKAVSHVARTRPSFYSLLQIESSGFVFLGMAPHKQTVVAYREFRNDPNLVGPIESFTAMIPSGFGPHSWEVLPLRGITSRPTLGGTPRTTSGNSQRDSSKWQNQMHRRTQGVLYPSW